MSQIACETCLKLQKAYSAALRIYADALQSHTDLISQREYTKAPESKRAILQADELCIQHRMALQKHETEMHGKAPIANS